MFMKKKMKIFIWICFLFIFNQSVVANIIGNDSLITIKYGIFLKKISPDFKEGKFNAEFYWWVIFQNDSTKTGVSNEEILNLEYVNGFECEIGGVINEIQEKKELSPNLFYYTGFHQGTFYFNPDFKMYPFDIQTLNISVENSLLSINKLRFIPDSGSYLLSNQKKNNWGISYDIINNNNANYKFFKTEITSGIGIYNSNFGDPTFEPQSKYGRIIISVFINRSFAPYISKLLIPLMIILLLVYFVFFLPPEKIDISAGLTVTSLLSAIAFQLAVSGELPEIGYIIYIDKIFYTCYFLIAIGLAQSLITFYLDDSGDEKKKKLAVNLDLLFRYLFPIIFISSVILFAI